MKKTSKNVRNETKKTPAAEFKKRYAELESRVKAIRTRLKDALKDAKVLEKNAYDLVQFGNKNLYTENARGVRPAFPSLPRKMGMLERWADIWFDISDVITYC